MRKMMIEISFPESVSATEIKDYAQDALEHWGGQRHPDDHLFGTVRAPKSKMKIVPGHVSAELRTRK